MMKNLFEKTTHLLDDKSGATAIEYAIIAGGIAIAIVLAVYAIGTEVDGVFSSVATGF